MTKVFFFSIIAIYHLTLSYACLENVLSEGCKCSKSLDHTNKIELHCTSTDVSNIQKDFGTVYSKGEVPVELSIRDTDLAGLDSIPEHMHLLENLKLINVEIDALKLQMLMSPLDDLKKLLFDGMKIPVLSNSMFGNKPSIEELILDRDGIMKIDYNAFGEFKDNLKSLQLRENKLTTIPEAVYSLNKLEVLDLSDNIIKGADKEMVRSLDENLHNLRQLNLNNIDCSCEFSEQDFYKYIKKKQFMAVLCSAGKPVLQMTKEDFCGSDGGADSLTSLNYLFITTLFAFLQLYQ